MYPTDAPTPQERCLRSTNTGKATVRNQPANYQYQPAIRSPVRLSILNRKGLYIAWETVSLATLKPQAGKALVYKRYGEVPVDVGDK